MPVDNASNAALLQSDERSSTESFDSIDSDKKKGEKSEYQGRSGALGFPSHSVLLAHICLLLLYTTVFIAAFLHLFPQQAPTCDIPLSREDLLSSPLRNALQYKVRTVGYNFEDINPFKGHSIEEIEVQWMYALNGAHEVRVSEAQMTDSNLSSIMLADGTDDYVVQPIVYHMLHCLYTIYKYAHPDFYGEEPAGPGWVKTHTDHCVDNLRQFVQCHAGTGVSTFKWLNSRKLPWPVLNTRETCIDWEYFDGWVREHSVDMEEIVSFKGKNGPMLVHPKFGPITPEDYDDKEVNEHEREHGHHLPPEIAAEVNN